MRCTAFTWAPKLTARLAASEGRLPPRVQLMILVEISATQHYRGARAFPHHATARRKPAFATTRPTATTSPSTGDAPSIEPEASASIAAPLTPDGTVSGEPRTARPGVRRGR